MPTPQSITIDNVVYFLTPAPIQPTRPTQIRHPTLAGAFRELLANGRIDRDEGVAVLQHVNPEWTREQIINCSRQAQSKNEVSIYPPRDAEKQDWSPTTKLRSTKLMSETRYRAAAPRPVGLREWLGPKLADGEVHFYQPLLDQYNVETNRSGRQLCNVSHLRNIYGIVLDQENGTLLSAGGNS